MEALWQSILALLATFVTPDWAALIELLPIALAVIVAAWFLLTIRSFATAGPTRRAPARRAPVAPDHLHMPGPSTAPILAAGGTAALLWGLVVGGNALILGAILLVLTLLYWGREAIRDYDHATGSASSLPAVIHAGPPPGVHMPGPSFRPLLGALGTAALMAGLVSGGWLLAAGAIILVVTLVGWLVDAKAEYVKTAAADVTGHLENIPAPAWPRRLFQGMAALFVVALLLQTGVIPPKGGDTATGGTDGSPAPSEDSGATGSSFAIVAKDIAFDMTRLNVPANTAFVIAFSNRDVPGVAHDVDVRAADKKTVVQDQAVVNGGESATYSFDGLAAGDYVFICSVHPIPQMTGTISVK
ncbi:MAG: Cupredoxin 1 protein [Chloroflexi bacterium]|nr:Cupredoxin 1 protein [Chloroflexota bacterium]